MSFHEATYAPRRLTRRLTVLIVLLTLLSVCAVLTGCVRGSYERTTTLPDGSVVVDRFRYLRTGSQEISGFEAVGPDGEYVKFDAQKSDAGAVTEAAFRGLGQGLRDAASP